MVEPKSIADLLKDVEDKEAKAYKSVEVVKEVDLDYDMGHLMATDPNLLDAKQLRSNPDKYLNVLARDDVQLVINKMWSLETKRVDNVLVAKLPAPVMVLPRAKKVPKAKAPTKWEQYSKEKGINKRKKEKLVWDETAKDWKPRFGYRRGVGGDKADWLIEVPVNQDPNVDYFEKKQDEKKERVSKNELQRLRNIARAQKLKIPSSGGITPSLVKTKDEVAKAAFIAKGATASLGKFEQKLPNEKPLKNSGKKRKFEPNLQNLGKEKEKNLEIVDQIVNKVPKLNVEKATRACIAREEKASAEENKKFPKRSSKHSGDKGGRKKNKGGSFKGKKGQGAFKGSKGGDFGSKGAFTPKGGGSKGGTRGGGSKKRAGKRR